MGATEQTFCLNPNLKAWQVKNSHSYSHFKIKLNLLQTVTMKNSFLEKKRKREEKNEDQISAKALQANRFDFYTRWE